MRLTRPASSAAMRAAPAMVRSQLASFLLRSVLRDQPASADPSQNSNSEATSTSFACPADFDLNVHWGAGAYICGEETALIESLEGKTVCRFSVDSSL